MVHFIFIPLALLVVPWLIVRFVFKTPQTAKLAYKKHAWYLIGASAVWIAAMVLPNIAVSPETQTTTMHTLGGVVAAILFFYTLQVYGIKFKLWWQPILGLFFFASGLGVLNELLEFAMKRWGVPGVVGGDEWWDLTANTFGAYATYLVYLLINMFKVARK